MTVNYSSRLLKNVHEFIVPPEDGSSYIVKGNYEYWHYGCDGFNDEGWGCGYRTLQTLCSWIISCQNLELNSVPSIRDIQEILVKVEDKDLTFLGSKEWIGSFEVSLVLNHLYDVLSKIIYFRDGSALWKEIPLIKKHFKEIGSPIMMGGDIDCSSKCVVGVHEGTKNTFLLIVDPHFIGEAKQAKQLENWVKWQNLNDFTKTSSYNLCCPIKPYVEM